MKRCAALLIGLVFGCQQPAPPARPPTAQEMAAEAVVVNYAPALLRLFPDKSSAGTPRYAILASERPELPASFRPLGVSDRGPPAGFVPRPGPFTWVDGQLLADPAAAPAKDGKGAVPGTLLVYGKDGNLKLRRTLPIPCTPTSPLLLQPVPAGPAGERAVALVRCRGDDRALLLSLTGEGEAGTTEAFPGGAETELFLHDREADYLLSGRRVVRFPPIGKPTIGTVPPPGGGADTRELLLSGDDLLVIDGAAGRVIRMDRRQMGWRGEQHFPVGPHVTRMRAVLAGDRVMVVWAEDLGGQSELLGVAVPLSGAKVPQRLLLSLGPGRSDHDLVPVNAAQGGGALLCRTHPGNSGPLVGLTRLNF